MSIEVTGAMPVEGVKYATFEAVVIRADGRRENLGVVAIDKSWPLTKRIKFLVKTRILKQRVDRDWLLS